MKKITNNNEKMNLQFPNWPPQNNSNDQTPLILALGFMLAISLVVIFGLLILVINK